MLLYFDVCQRFFYFLDTFPHYPPFHLCYFMGKEEIF
nr:MAG TPA: hypothetical protein [Caudoviricetes sp.]